MKETIQIPKVFIELIDQVFEVEKKLKGLTEENSIHRNVNRMKDVLEYGHDDWGITYHSPLGEAYNETRTDVEASIAGTSADGLVVTEVIKPIIRYKKGGLNVIVRKGVVVAETQK